MKNITLITSVINTPNIPLSYTNTRSVYTKEVRFEQLKKTIETVREKIRDNRIFLIECSLLSLSEQQYLTNAVDYFVNIHDTENQTLINRMFTSSKSMGEGTMTINALQYLLSNNIEFDNFFKISGRYWLNNTFSYELYDNYSSVIRHIGDNNYVFTCFYKLSKDASLLWLDYLINSENEFVNCMNYESIFAEFFKKMNINDTVITNNLGVNGNIAVCGTHINV